MTIELDFLQLRFVIEPTMLEVFVLVNAGGGVSVWHHKSFPDNFGISDVCERIGDGRENVATWPCERPVEA